MTVDTKLLRKENNFDFFRFVAAALVIFSHCYHLTPSTKEPLLAFSNEKYELGHLSIGVFFVISGFLIFRSYERSVTLGHFFKARILRIYPALIFLIVCTVFILGPWFTDKAPADYFRNESTLKYLANIFAIQTQFVLPGVFEKNFHPFVVNASLWTLPNEIACYLLIALAGLITRKRILAATLIAAVTFALFKNKFLHEMDTFDVQLTFFACGALIYKFRKKIHLTLPYFLLSVLTLLIVLRYSYQLPNMILTKLIITLMKSASLSYIVIYLSFSKTKHLKQFAKNGDFSYGLYIWSYPIQQILCLYFPGINTFSLFIYSLTITFCISVFSWHLIEKRFLSLKRTSHTRGDAGSANSILTYITDQQHVGG